MQDDEGQQMFDHHNDEMHQTLFLPSEKLSPMQSQPEFLFPKAEEEELGGASRLMNSTQSPQDEELLQICIKCGAIQLSKESL